MFFYGEGQDLFGYGDFKRSIDFGLRNNARECVLYRTILEDSLDVVRLEKVQLLLRLRQNSFYDFAQDPIRWQSTNDYKSPLLLAVRMGLNKIVRCLMNGGFDVNYQDLRGKTALSIATESGNSELVDWLLQQRK